MLRQLGSYAALKGGLLHDGDDGRPAVPAPSETTTPLLVPVFVTAQSGLDTALLRAGGPWGAAAAGTRLAAELGATAPQVGRVLAAQLATGTASCESQELGWGPRLAEIRLAVTVGRLRFCETLLWDVLHPHAQRVAADFAAQTCADLGLGNEFVDAIFQSIIAQAEDKKQSILAELEEREEGVELLAPATAEWVGEWRPEEWPGPLLQWIA